MVDITGKSNTLRVAVAEATVHVSTTETIRAIENNLIPKGNVFEMSKAAGLFGVKRTYDMIPDCHPLPIEYTSIKHEIIGLDIRITVEVKTIYKTGVEVEAMHGASVVALTMYDMLKPIDKAVEIRNIRLLEKHGGKSDFKDKQLKDLKATVVVCSDTIAAGDKEDLAGKAIIQKLEDCNVVIRDYLIIPDVKEIIESVAVKESDEGTDLIIFTGGTGLSIRDVTPEALEPLLERTIPGIEETIRSYGQQRTPYSMLSRSVAGVRKESLILALPGSTKGASESMDSIFPSVLHLFKIFKGTRHD